MNLLNKFFGDEHKRTIKSLEPTIKKINDLEPAMEALSDDELRGKTQEFKKSLTEGKTLDDILPEAFAVVREASRRVHDQRHFDVQLIGGIIIHQGKIAEMRTGEGKTLVATLPAYLNALTGRGVHVVTVNDYLARRDGVWMGEIYDFLGLTVGIINSSNQSFLYDQGQVKEGDPIDDIRDEEGGFRVVHEFMRPVSRNEAYEADIP